MRLLTYPIALTVFYSAALAAERSQTALAVYQVKPSDVTVPEGEEIGAFRRIIQPFKNWTLICDESLVSKRAVCNVTQSITDQRGSVVFNWSLVASASGRPLMVMRVPAAAGKGQKIALAMGPTPDRIVAQTDTCDPNFCFATIAIGDMLKKHIQASTECAVSYRLPQAGTVSFQAPLHGLFLALDELS